MSTAPRNRQLSLLIGDDDSSVRECVAELVTPMGCQVHLAATGGESLRILLGTPIDLSILDIHMPDMTGMEVFERYVRGPFIAGPDRAPAPPQPRRLAAIFMSSEATPEIRSFCESTGSWFLDKPFTPGDMRLAIERLLLTERFRS
jgi:CheY-like chemotaxis protein